MRNEWAPREHGAERRGLQRRAARGLGWTFIDTWGSQLIGLLIFTLLARLLTEVDFGLVALAGVFVSFAALFVDLGLGDALIQRKTVTRSNMDTAFWVSVAIGVVLALVGVAAAIPIAALVRQPELAPIIAALSLTLIIGSLSSVQIALLRRELNFRRLAVRRLLALVVSGAVGVGAALLDYGAWALVAQQLSYGVVSVVTLWTVSPWRPGFTVSRADFRELSAFGTRIVGGDALGFISRNSDNLLIGAVLGAAPLGLYAVGYRILETTQTLLVAASRKLAFPVLSQMQGDPDRLRRAYGRVNRMVAMVVMPGYVGLAVVAQDAIVVLFGERWAPSGPVAAVLFLIGPALTLQVFSGALMNATGHPNITLRFRLLTTVVHLIGFLGAVLIFGNILAVAAAFVLGMYILLPVNLYLQQKYAGINLVEHLSQLRWIAVATLVMAAAVLLARFALVDRMGPVTLLATELLVGVVVYAVALLAVERRLMRDMLEIAGQALPGVHRLPRRLRPASATRRKRRLPAQEELQETLVPDDAIDPTQSVQRVGLGPPVERASDQ